MNHAMILITEEFLTKLGFVQLKGSTGDYYPYHVRRVYDVDMGEKDWAEIILQRGNGTDPDCWNVLYRRNHTGLNVPAHHVWIRHGLRYEHEVNQLGAVFWPENK